MMELTNSEKWLLAHARKLGTDLEGARADMRRKRARQTPPNLGKRGGFASFSPEKRREIALRGVEARRKKLEN